MATRVANARFYSNAVSQLVPAERPEEIVVEIDATAPIGPVSNKQVVVVDVQPHPWAQEVAEGIWNQLDWHEVDDNDVDPAEIDVAKRGWSCRMTVRYS